MEGIILVKPDNSQIFVSPLIIARGGLHEEEVLITPFKGKKSLLHWLDGLCRDAPRDEDGCIDFIDRVSEEILAYN